MLVHGKFHTSPLVQWDKQLLSINCSSVLYSNVYELELVTEVQDITSQEEKATLVKGAATELELKTNPLIWSFSHKIYRFQSRPIISHGPYMCQSCAAASNHVIPQPQGWYLCSVIVVNPAGKKHIAQGPQAKWMV